MFMCWAVSGIIIIVILGGIASSYNIVLLVRKRIHNRGQTLREGMSLWMFWLPSVLIVVYILLLGLGVISYFDGKVPRIFPAVVLLPGAAIPSILLVLLTRAILVLSSKWETWVPLGIVLLSIFTATGGYCFYRHSDVSNRKYMEGVQERMKLFNPAAVQRWIEEDVIPSRERGNIDEKRWPSSIRQLNPDRVYLKDDKCLVITWVIMRDFYEAYAVCLENQRPEWIPSHAKRVGNGYLWRRFE